jgi:ferredoxin
MVGKLEVTVDQRMCVGNGMCLHFAPKSFQLNDDRQSQVADPNGDPRERVLEAAEGCPVSAIRVVDAETGEQLFP